MSAMPATKSWARHSRTGPESLNSIREVWMPREDHNYVPLRSVTFRLNHENTIVCDIAIPHLAVDVRQKPQ